MILYPAIDLKGGQCVRLLRGEMAKVTVFNEDPADQARAFADKGCEWLHLVDLDGAVAGKPVNGPAIEAILAAIAIPVQLGGGLRDLETITRWLGAGVRRAILGTAALRNPELVREAAKAYPDRVAVGIDAKDGKVAVQGWAETSEIGAVDLAKRFEDAGVAAIIFTDIARDGMLQGVNVEATATLANSVRIPIIASGGIASLDDIKALKAAPSSNILGTIIGRALYEGSVTPREALTLADSR